MSAKTSQLSSRRSTQESAEGDEEIPCSSSSRSSTPKSMKTDITPLPGATTTGEVVGGHCLVCNDRCFIRPASEKLTNAERNLSYELRAVFYDIYQIPVTDQDFLESKAEKSEFPLCYSCSFHLGQLKHLYHRLNELHREFIKFQETVAFSIVDVVAGAVPQRSLLDFSKISKKATVCLLEKSERTTLQNMIYNEWYNKVPSFPEFDSDSIPKINPIVDSPQVSTGMYPPVRMDLPLENPNVLSRQIVSKSTVERSNNRTGKTTVISITTKEEDNDPPLSSAVSKRMKLDSGNGGKPISRHEMDENGHLNVEDDEGSPNNIDIDFDYYSQDYQKAYQEDNAEIIGDEDQMLGDVGDDDTVEQLALSHRGHFLDASSNGRDEHDQLGEEEEFNEFEQLYEDAGFDDGEEGLEGGLKRRDSTADSIGEMNSNSIEYQQNEDGLFVCMFCSKTFIHKYPYRDHLKTHTGEGPRCPICNKIFPKNHNLMLHMRTHTGEKPYKCDVCRKGFADKSNLKVHMRVHTGERPYKCEFCNLAFVNSSRLVVHRRMHTGEKPFTCTICSKCFSTSNQLASHRKIHMTFDDTRPFGCMTCGKSFSTEENLQSHIVNYHPDAIME